jgi:hypothetical protein
MVSQFNASGTLLIFNKETYEFEAIFNHMNI